MTNGTISKGGEFSSRMDQGTRGELLCAIGRAGAGGCGTAVQSCQERALQACRCLVLQGSSRSRDSVGIRRALLYLGERR